MIGPRIGAGPTVTAAHRRASRPIGIRRRDEYEREAREKSCYCFRMHGLLLRPPQMNATSLFLS